VKKSRFTDEQIAYAMKQAETGSPGASLIALVPQILLPGSGGGRWSPLLLPGSARPCSFRIT
jgi:hypothetical protein